MGTGSKETKLSMRHALNKKRVPC